MRMFKNRFPRLAMEWAEETRRPRKLCREGIKKAMIKQGLKDEQCQIREGIEETLGNWVVVIYTLNQHKNR